MCQQESLVVLNIWGGTKPFENQMKGMALSSEILMHETTFLHKIPEYGPLDACLIDPFPRYTLFFFLILVLSNKYKLITTHDFNIFLQYT